jgi:hypothetical protein
VIFSHGNSHLLTLHAGERKISNIRTQSHTKNSEGIVDFFEQKGHQSLTVNITILTDPHWDLLHHSL